MQSQTHQHVLVTGSGGHIGRTVVAGLLDAGHRVRGFDRVAHPDLADQIVGNLTDRDAVARAVADVDSVIHLAAQPNRAAFVEVLVPDNVIGLHNVVTAAVEAGVKRLILASSIQVVGRGARAADDKIPIDFAAPDNDYALTKLWAEELGRMVARNHPIEVIAARLGWFVRDTAEAKRMWERDRMHAYYIARSDTVHFFRAAIETPTLDVPDRYATLYAIGPGTADQPTPVDLEPGRRLIGFNPVVSWPGEAPTGA